MNLSDPYMAALGQRAYEAHAKVLKVVRPWSELPDEEKGAWAVAAREAGQNYPAPVIVEMTVRLPNHRLPTLEPLQVKLWGQDTAAGVEGMTRRFKDYLLEVLRLRSDE